ncbi:hypothetical protein TNCV_1132951 [Trichonephila clavipes]|nr:hypothetical protein TNCV_1132951 [Trichonephila clavipes]
MKLPIFMVEIEKSPIPQTSSSLRLVATSQSKLIHITADQEQCSAITATSFTIPQQTATLKPAALSAAKLIERATAP